MMKAAMPFDASVNHSETSPRSHFTSDMLKLLFILLPIIGKLIGALMFNLGVISASSVIFGSAMGAAALPIACGLGAAIGFGLSLMVSGCFLLANSSSSPKRIGGAFLTSLSAVGMGATIGSMLPIPGIGTIIGAGIGFLCSLVLTGIVTKCSFRSADGKGAQDQIIPGTPKGQGSSSLSQCGQILGAQNQPEDKPSALDNLASPPLFKPDPESKSKSSASSLITDSNRGPAHAF